MPLFAGRPAASEFVYPALVMVLTRPNSARLPIKPGKITLFARSTHCFYVDPLLRKQATARLPGGDDFTPHFQFTDTEMTVPSSRFRRLRWREVGVLLVLGACAIPATLPAAAKSPKLPPTPTSIGAGSDHASVPGSFDPNPQIWPIHTIVPGKWKIETHWKGKVTSYLDFSDGAMKLFARSWKDNGSDIDGYGINEWRPLEDGVSGNEFGYYSLPPDVTITGAGSDTTGIVTVICTWVDAHAYDTPPLNPVVEPAPKTLTLLEIPDAAGSGYPGSSADDGMGDPATGRSLYPDTPNYPLSWTESGGVIYPATWPVAHLTTHQVTGGTVTFSHSMHAASTLFGEIESPIAALSYTVKEDPRTVRLYRPGAINETVDADGTTRGDSTFSYPIITASDSTNAENSQLFHTSFSGNWALAGGLYPTGTLDVNFQWSMPFNGENFIPDLYTDRGIMPYGTVHLSNSLNLDEWLGTPDSPKSFNIGFHIQDNYDGATADATYVLTLHDQIEDAQDSITNTSTSSPAWGSSTDDSNPNALFIVQGNGQEVPAQSQSISKGHSTTQGWNSYVEFAPAVFQKLFQLNLGVAYTDTHDSSWQITSNLPVVVPDQMYTYPVIISYYRRHTITFRHFMPEGEHLLGYHIVGHGPLPIPHTDTQDEFAGNGIDWVKPQSTSVPYPVFDPAHIPQTPPPANQ